VITLYNESLAKYSSFRTGGSADTVMFPESVKEFIAAKKENPSFPVLGNMSNTLILDGGISGGVIITTKMNGISVSGNTVEAMAGATLSAVACAARDNSLTGGEFLFGIPGTVGGGVYMNAGAYGGEIASVIDSVTALADNSEVITLKKNELQLGYRTSRLQSENLMLLSARFTFAEGNKDKITAYMNELMNRRITSQPLDKPSCGSTFKRPEGHFAGKLITDCGLKGVSIGGAQVSEKHAGFIINKGGATSRDITDLIALVKKTVLEQTGVALSEEIRIIGRE